MVFDPHSGLVSIRHTDLLKSDTPINKAKVSLKLHELEYKLDVEKKVQEGTKKLAQAYGADPASQTDRRRRHEVSLNLAESNEKIALLKKAVQKYKNLYIGEGDDDDGEYLIYCHCFHIDCRPSCIHNLRKR